MTSSTSPSGRSAEIISRASTPSSANATEYPLKDRDLRSDSRTARSSSTTRIRTATSFIQSPEILLRGGKTDGRELRAVLPGDSAHGKQISGGRGRSDRGAPP